MRQRQPFVLSGLIALAFLSGCAGSSTPAALTVTGQPTSLSVSSTSEPTAQPATPTPSEPYPGDGPWDVTFQTADGVTLSGRMFGHGEVGVVLAPMHPGEQEAWYPFAEEAAAQGYRALAFDFRGYGTSEGARDLSAAPQDLTAAIAFLREQDAGRIVLAGAAQGGMAAIIVAAGGEPVEGLAVISSARSFDGLEISDEQLAALTMPTLWIGARTDMTQQVEDMAAQATASDASVWIYEGSSLHGTYIFEGADASDLTQRLLAFFARVTGR